MAQLLTKFDTSKGGLILNSLEWTPVLNPNKQTTKPPCQQSCITELLILVISGYTLSLDTYLITSV